MARAKQRDPHKEAHWRKLLQLSAYQSRKHALKPILVELAKLASADIVHSAS